MSAFVLKLDIAGDTQVLSALSRFGEYADDLSQAFKEIADDFFERVEPARFKAEGPGWAPLSPRYARWKRARYGDKPILQREGDLKTSLTGGRGAIRTVHKHELIIGTSVPYARYHQEGTSIMPAREVVRIDQADRVTWMKIIQRDLVRAAREAKLDAKAAS